MRDAKPGTLTRGYATFNVGYALLNLGKCRDALPFLRRSLKIQPPENQVYIQERITAGEELRARWSIRAAAVPLVGRRRRILLEGREQPEREGGRQLRTPLPRIGRRLEEVREAELGLTAPGERGLADEALVQHATECVDVARACRFLALDQLRREVLQRADELAVARQLRRVRAAREAEVGERGDAVVVEQHVRRLHVAMDDPAGVQRIETLPELRREVDRRVERESPLGAESVAQRAAAVERHHDVAVSPTSSTGTR